MKKNYKKFATSVFIFFIILLLSFSIIMANNTINESKYEVNNEKIYYEIKYFDTQITKMTNLLNNIENTPNFYIEWHELQKQTKILYNYWNSIILDLNKLSINKKHLTDFGKELDELSVSISHKDKNQTFNNLIELYNKLIIYSEAIDYNYYKYILLTKYHLLCSYSIVETGNWTIVHENILKSSKYIGTIVNDTKKNEYNINQAYIAVKEMENLINIKNKELFFIKYKIAIDKLNNLIDI